MAFSIRMTEEERKLADSYAALHGITVAEAFKKALFERIEDEYDVTLFEQAMDEYNKNPVTYSHEEVRKMLDL